MIDLSKLQGPTLVMTVGLPRSGKTTWAQKQGVPVVQPDAIRLAIHGQAYLHQAESLVWAHADVMVRALFGAGHRVVILDSTAGQKHRRDRWRWTSWDLRFKVFDTPREVCEERAREWGREDLLPVIERMARTWEPLDSHELMELVPVLPVPCPAEALAGQVSQDVLAAVCATCGQFAPCDPTAPRVPENCAMKKVQEVAEALKKSGD